jgi:large subunit ribosomal protein L30
MSKHLRLVQRKSTFGQPEAQRKVLAGLGLRGIHKSVVVENTPSFRGMIKKVIHLVDITEVDSKELKK